MLTKRDARFLPPEAQEELRRRAVAAVMSGETVTAVARVLGVARQSVHLWLRQEHEGGEEALRRRRRGPPPGSGALLEPWQQAIIVNMIKDRCPDQLKLPFCLWTREAVADLIKQRFGINIAVRTVGDYLCQWGFTPQKPKNRAFEADDAAVRRWREREYPRIVKRAKREGAEIHWGDETGIRSDHHAGRSYAPRGKTPVVRNPGRRFGANVISSITNRGTLRFMVFGRRFTADVFIRFLERLVRKAPRKIFLILDRHPVHESRRVEQWREDNADRIEFFFLPPYSPQANPDEYLNNDLKTNAVGRRRFRDIGEMVGHVRSYLYATQKRPDIVRSYFRHPEVHYAA